MAARKKAKAPARKAARKSAAVKQRAAPRALPNDEAWRELVATAVEKPDPVAQAAAVTTPKAPAKGKAKKK